MATAGFQEALLYKFRLIGEDGVNLAQLAVRRYFSTQGDRFTGSQFESLIDSKHPNTITERDLLAVNALSVEIPIRASIWILSDEGRAQIEQCLIAVRPDMSIWDPDAEAVLAPGGPMHKLWEMLGTASWPTPKSGNGLGGRTKRSKLLAAKRPGLVPVTDQVVRGALPEVDDYWVAFRDALSEQSVRDEIAAATSEAPAEVTLLRRIDAAIWKMSEGSK